MLSIAGNSWGRQAPQRLQLDVDDLLKLRISAPWGPLSEGMFSLMRLQDRRPDRTIDGWRRRVHGQIEGWAWPLFMLASTRPLVDLHTLVGQTDSVDAALETLLTAPATHLRTALRPLTDRVSSDTTPASTRTWAGDLAAGDRQARQDLVKRFRRYLRLAIVPYWGAIRSQLDADRARRARIMAEGGIEELLSSLHPRVRWRSPDLGVHTSGRAGPAQRPEISMLDGRSLFLVPSAFARGGPYLLPGLTDDRAPVLLIFPARCDLDGAVNGRTDDRAGHSRALGRLLGRTRAEALRAVVDVCTTTDLARRIGVTPATASHHASILREAGLIETEHWRTAALHRITQLGAGLLYPTGDARTGNGAALPQESTAARSMG